MSLTTATTRFMPSGTMSFKVYLYPEKTAVPVFGPPLKDPGFSRAEVFHIKAPGIITGATEHIVYLLFDVILTIIHGAPRVNPWYPAKADKKTVKSS